MAKNKKSRSGPSMAERADRHALYEQSVQDTEAEFEFVDGEYQRLRGRPAATLREDFCGTAQMCCEWVRQRPGNRAIGVDLDPEVLAWGREHNLGRLSPAERERVTLIEEDVRTVRTEPTDIVLAMNFSYQLFQTRDGLRAYFHKVYNDLAEGGVLFMDSFGGYDAYREIKEKTKHKGFTYIWDQAKYDPVTGSMDCYIHFHFPDGSKLKRAFAYHWRLWTLPELQEILREAGFAEVTVYWQGTDEETGEGNGEFEPATEGEADPGWICYLAAQK